MKALSIILCTLFSISALAETAQILRAKLDPTHLEPANFRGGIIEKNDQRIKLVIFALPTNASEMKEIVIEMEGQNIGMNTCNELVYVAETEDTQITLIDSSESTCDDVMLFPVNLTYTTFDGEKEYTSTFNAARFSSLTGHINKIKVGTTTTSNGQPSTLPVFYGDSSNEHEQPVLLPIVYDM